MQFIHTADWHLGNNFSLFTPEQNKKLKRARIAAVKSIFIYADKNGIPLIISAGDQIDNGEVRNERILKDLFLIIENYRHIKVIMIAGNHDPLSSQSIYSRLSKNYFPENLYFVKDREKLEFPEYGCVVFASSLKSKNGTINPLEWIPNNGTGENLIRIGVAHGSLKIEGKYNVEDFPIETDFSFAKKLNYLALGHWHSYYKHNDYTYYPGTPEPLQFKDSGCILRVSIDKAGNIPLVEKVPVHQFSWDTDTVDIVSSEDVDLLYKKLKRNASLQRIVKLILNGNLSLRDFHSLKEQLEKFKDNYFSFFTENNISLVPSSDDLSKILPQGYLAKIVDELNDLRKPANKSILDFINDENIAKEDVINYALLEIFNHFRKD